MTTEVDALAHDDVLIFVIYDWFPHRKRGAGT
jgi:hypothetical protein